MSLLEAILLGIVQGLTEFLPISSSGHLVLFQNILGMKEPMIAFDIAVHWGTLAAVLIYFARDFFRMIGHTFLFLIHLPVKRNLDALFNQYPYALIFILVVLATIPTIVIAMVFQDAFEFFFGSLLAVGIAWIVMSIALIASRKFQEGYRSMNLMNHRDAFLIGIAQGISIMPGISRSGVTILLGMFLGLEKKEAARFSFWIAVPTIIGAGIFKRHEGIEFYNNHGMILVAGFMAAAITGFFAIAFLLRIIQHGKFYIFGYYCLAIGLLTLIYWLVSGLLG